MLSTDMEPMKVILVILLILMLVSVILILVKSEDLFVSHDISTFNSQITSCSARVVALIT